MPEILQAIRRRKPGKAANANGVVAEFLQDAPTCVLERLQLRFNTVLAHGAAPTSWRNTFCLYIHHVNKNGQRAARDGFRPLRKHPFVLQSFSQLDSQVQGDTCGSKTFSSSSKRTASCIDLENSKISSANCKSNNKNMPSEKSTSQRLLVPSLQPWPIVALQKTSVKHRAGSESIRNVFFSRTFLRLIHKGF